MEEMQIEEGKKATEKEQICRKHLWYGMSRDLFRRVIAATSPPLKCCVLRVTYLSTNERACRRG